MNTMKTFPNFFFGATSRPLMISLSPDFTYFDLRFCDCTGLLIEPDNTNPHQGINLRTAAEVSLCANWLRTLAETLPIELNGSTPISNVEELRLPGFSPEFEDESCQWGEAPDDKYDATELHLYGVWRNDKQEGICFHLAASTEVDPEAPSTLGLDAQGIPLNLMADFANALSTIALAMDTDSLDLTKDQPLSE